MIEFNRPFYDDEEIRCVEDAIVKDTDYLGLVKKWFSEYLLKNDLYFTCNGSSALEMLFASMNLKENSQVIMPSFNFPSAANSALRMGALPVFADIDIDTLTMSFDETDKKTTSDTMCITPIHYGGASMDMDLLMNFAKKRDIVVLEDAALSFGGEYKNRKLGTIGDFGILSFDQTKNLSCGKGGLAINNGISSISDLHIERMYNNGTDKQEFLDNKVSFYSWKQVGMNVAMSNINAAMLYAQTKKIEIVNNLRKRIYDYYNDSLMPYGEQFGFKLPIIPKDNKNNHHVFYIVFESNEKREKLRLELKENGIFAHVHYTPLHLSKMGKDLGYRYGDLPVTEKISETMLRLPLHNSMKFEDAEIVVSEIRKLL